MHLRLHLHLRAFVLMFLLRLTSSSCVSFRRSQPSPGSNISSPHSQTEHVVRSFDLIEELACVQNGTVRPGIGKHRVKPCGASQGVRTIAKVSALANPVFESPTHCFTNVLIVLLRHQVWRVYIRCSA